MGAVVALGVGLHASLAFADVEPEKGIGYPRDVSVDGHRIDWLLNITTVFCAILFVIMVIWMAIAIFKHNHKHEALYDHGSARSQLKVALSLSALIFFVVDGNLYVTSMIDLDQVFWNFKLPESHPRAVRIEVNARQWVWDARYAGPDDEFNTPDDIVTTNDIRVPVGVPVLINLAAVDVIHSMYLPNLRAKQDAVPGVINHLWFRAKETGEFDIACAQHCGANHYRMKGKLTILDGRDFEAWARQASAASERAFDPNDAEAHWGWRWEENF
jgi:cytochrome c oxidase subunit 2